MSSYVAPMEDNGKNIKTTSVNQAEKNKKL
jgi:hypothetical protein